MHYLVTSKCMVKIFKKQTTKDIFLKRILPPQNEPQAGPSGGIPGALLSEVTAPCMSLPPNLSVRQSVEVEDSGTDTPDPVWA